MEDQGIGHFCAICNKKDYFSFECSSCKKHFCGDCRNKCDCTPEQENVDRP